MHQLHRGSHAGGAGSMLEAERAREAETLPTSYEGTRLNPKITQDNLE